MGDLKHDRVHTGYDLEEEYFYFLNRENLEKFRAKHKLRLIQGGRSDSDPPRNKEEQQRSASHLKRVA